MELAGRSTTSMRPRGAASGHNQPPPRAAILAHDGDVAALAATQARAAANQLAEADDAVTLARARLDEAIAAAPRVSPRVAAAIGEVAAAETAVDTAAEAVLDAVREVNDRAGAVVVAQARVDYLQTAGTANPAQEVAADEALAKAQRASTAAEHARDRAERAREDAGSVLAGAEQALEIVRSTPHADPSSVLKARMELGRSERARNAAQEHAVATKRAYEQVVHNSGSGAAGLPVQMFYGSLEQFVVEYVLRNRRRRAGANNEHWCGQWWKHAEAVTRLGHVWEAFEVYRHEKPPSLSTLWRDHIDYHMRVLTDPHGPFEKCSETHHEPWPRWVSTPAEDGLFPYDRDCEFEDVVRQRQEAEESARSTRLGGVDRADQGEGVRA